MQREGVDTWLNGWYVEVTLSHCLVEWFLFTVLTPAIAELHLVDLVPECIEHFTEPIGH